MSKLIIEAGKYYRTRSGKKAYCVAVVLPSPDGFYKDEYPVLVVTDRHIYSTTINGLSYSVSSPDATDIVSEWVEPVIARTFKSPTQLAKALIKGQKWVCDGDKSYCYWDTIYSKFRVGPYDMKLTWSYADGKTLWTKVD